MHKKNYNCAQKVLSAFADKYQIQQDLIDEFRKYGFGRSPNGECGALFAAKYLLQKDPVAAAEIEQKFLRLAGNTECKLIRAHSKISCRKCIEIIIDFLQK